MTETSNNDGRPSQNLQYHQETHVEPGGKAYIVQHGNMTVYQWRPEYRIEEYRFSIPAQDPAALRVQPSRMLRAQYQIVPFDVDRRIKEIERITEWRDRDDGTASLLLYGPGGQGKTRLASYVTKAASIAGWQVLQGTLNHTGIPGGELVTTELSTAGKAGVMLLVDYAERWPFTALMSLMQDPVLSRGRLPLRIILIARPAGTWWQSLSYRINSELQFSSERIRLSVLADQPGQWPQVLETARDAFLNAYALPEPVTVEIPETVANEEYPLVLAAHMAALALVDTAIRGQPAPHGSAAITEYLLGRERTHWAELHETDPRRFSTHPTVMARTVFTATLTRALGYEEGELALRRIGAVETVQPTASVLSDHAVCYPPSDIATVLEPLYPDRLGEDFIALSVPAHQNPDPALPEGNEICDPWAANAVFRLLSLDEHPPQSWTPSAITTLVETAHRWPHIANEQLFPIVRRQPQLMLLAGGATLASFSELPTVPIDVLEEIERILPAGRQSDLAIGRAATAERLAEFRLAHTKDLAQQAAIYNTLRQALADAGLREKERAVTDKEVKLYRILALENPGDFLVPLAIALDAYGSTFLTTEDLKSSIRAQMQAVTIYRRLYGQQPGIFASELARTLMNLGNSYLRIRLLDEALQAQQEAVQIRRSADQTERNLSDGLGLARSLVQLSVTLLNHERQSEALGLMEEAVAIFRSINNIDEIRFDQGVFAHALEIQARILILMDRCDETIAPLNEAVNILRPLVSSNPAVHEGLLSQVLSEQGVAYSNLGRISEGIESLREAVEIFSATPDRRGIHGIEPNFVGMLCNLGGALVTGGRASAAIPVLRDAVEKARFLREADPHEVLLLPLSLYNLTMSLVKLEQWEDALPIAEEAESIYRELASGLPETYTERWHKARDALAHIIRELNGGEDTPKVPPTSLS